MEDVDKFEPSCHLQETNSELAPFLEWTPSVCGGTGASLLRAAQRAFSQFQSIRTLETGPPFLFTLELFPGLSEQSLTAGSKFGASRYQVRLPNRCFSMTCLSPKHTRTHTHIHTLQSSHLKCTPQCHDS